MSHIDPGLVFAWQAAHSVARSSPPPGKGFPLDSSNLERSPVYIRFEPEGGGDNWNLRFAAALVYTNGQFVTAFTPPVAFDNLWMGTASGKILYLTDRWGRPDPVIKLARELAAKSFSVAGPVLPRIT
ncbi:hypothetical protein [Lysobacter sp. Root494]|uniref:hypothetical protein n=1 Tax=Lysobacter sp. Root494 TaxID=1736549 RepID=UPI001F27BB8D|nr:hypothetical protein [Lysobacter sp. Root494]